MPTILIYDRPSSGLEGKFSMPFCAAAAIVYGRVGIDTFDAAHAARSGDRRAAGAGDDARRSDARRRRRRRSRRRACTVRLRDGRVLTASANGARGYPEQPASDEELATKFTACATQTLSAAQAPMRWRRCARSSRVADIRTLTAVLATQG